MQATSKNYWYNIDVAMVERRYPSRFTTKEIIAACTTPRHTRRKVAYLDQIQQSEGIVAAAITELYGYEFGEPAVDSLLKYNMFVWPAQIASGFCHLRGRNYAVMCSKPLRSPRDISKDTKWRVVLVTQVQPLDDGSGRCMIIDD